MCNDDFVVSLLHSTYDIVNRYNADVNNLATEIAFAEQENYRASSPLCQAARNGYTEASLYSSYH